MHERAMGVSLVVGLVAGLGLGALSSEALAQAGFVAHSPGAGVFGEPGGVSQRTPTLPREGDTVELWIKVGPSFSYDHVAVYYTLDGSPPSGFQGAPANPSTVALTSAAGDVQFVRNEPGQSGNDDWWRVELPVDARLFDADVRYLVSAYGPGGNEVFATDPSDGDAIYAYTTLLAWPGSGSSGANPGEGYPPIWFWKEEGVVGNGDINAMIDQNGSVYDLYFPSAGAVRGVSTRNEGYYDGFNDQFPLGLQPNQTGQMHLNQAFFGIRPTDPGSGAGTTYWLTNQNGTDFADVAQAYTDGSNTILTSQRLVANGNDISVTQHHFAPLFDPVALYPTDGNGEALRSWIVHELELTNNGVDPAEINLYYFVDWELNGGPGFDGSFVDTARGAMVAFDNTQRFVNSAGEYNPTTGPDYEKNASVYLGARMLTGGATGVVTDQFWADTSGDQDRGWMGQKLTLPPGQPVRATVILAGGYDPFAAATGTYEFQIAPVFDAYDFTGMGNELGETDSEWGEWLDKGVRFSSSDPAYADLFDRGLLGTALHLDRENGGIIAGMHNGAYPYVWPRDAAWAGITLARAGHVEEAREIVRFLRDIAERDLEGWGREGFWKQKYTTDGQPIWTTPQVDETSCFPWLVRYLYDVTGDLSILEDNYDEVFEAALASSQDSTIDNRLRYEESVDLVFSMNLWEDSFDVFNYSNASVIRGLEDAAAIADILDQTVCPGGPGTCGYHTDKALFESRATAIRGGLDARLAWNGENTDISQLGITYPFEIYEPGHPRAELIMDRINGVASDAFGNVQPLVNFGGEWNDLINRYWGDSYWNNPALVPNANGSPWFLTTLWYGAYYAQRQDVTAMPADIDNHKYRIDLLLGEVGPMGFGAEQIASNNTLKYTGQTDYRLQTAYPNAWESMSFFVDAVMLFLGYEPDTDGTLRVRPKLPSDWAFMRYENLRVTDHRVDALIERDGDVRRHTFTNRTGNALPFETVLRFPAGETVASVTVNGVPVGATIDGALGAATVSGTIAGGIDAETVVELTIASPCAPADLAAPFGSLDFFDVLEYLALFDAQDPAADLAAPFGGFDFFDVLEYLAQFDTGC